MPDNGRLNQARIVEHNSRLIAEMCKNNIQYVELLYLWEDRKSFRRFSKETQYYNTICPKNRKIWAYVFVYLCVCACVFTTLPRVHSVAIINNPKKI